MEKKKLIRKFDDTYLFELIDKIKKKLKRLSKLTSIPC